MIKRQKTEILSWQNLQLENIGEKQIIRKWSGYGQVRECYGKVCIWCTEVVFGDIMRVSVCVLKGRIRSVLYEGVFECKTRVILTIVQYIPQQRKFDDLFEISRVTVVLSCAHSTSKCDFGHTVSYIISGHVWALGMCVCQRGGGGTPSDLRKKTQVFWFESNLIRSYINNQGCMMFLKPN